MDRLQEILRGRPDRLQDQASRLRLEDEALSEESHRHGDMVFVDVIDTYRNVPSKLLQFYNWYEFSNYLNGGCVCARVCACVRVHVCACVLVLVCVCSGGTSVGLFIYSSN